MIYSKSYQKKLYVIYENRMSVFHMSLGKTNLKILMPGMHGRVQYEEK